jgi:nucleotide-binding universal stress UspA family protein
VNQEHREMVIRRILVALDASPHSLAALEAAARLARLFEAELLGVYVEDINLLRAGGLPFGREISFHSGTRRRLSPAEIERQLRVQAEEARQALTETADQARVRWSFRVTRGGVAAELLTAAANMDLVIVGKAGWSPIQRRRLGSTARALLSQATIPALIIERGACFEAPVAVIYEGSPLAQAAISVASALAGLEHSHLVVLLLGDNPEVTRQLRDEVSERIRGTGLVARYHAIHGWSTLRVVESLEQENSGCLVLPATSEIMEEERTLLELLTHTGMPVLMVR